jgi:hypothetical protein
MQGEKSAMRDPGRFEVCRPGGAISQTHKIRCKIR